MAHIKKLISGGMQELVPPSQEEIKDWRACYLSYWNAELSVKKGRILPLSHCVKNPRPNEILEAFHALQIRAIFQGVSTQSSKNKSKEKT